MSAAPAGEAIVTRIARFARALRNQGLEVGPGRIQDALLALTTVEIGSREQTYWALRCTLVSKYGDLEAFDAAFARFYDRAPQEQPDLAPTPGQLGQHEPGTPELHGPAERERIEEPWDDENADEGQSTETGMRWSAIERLRDLDFARYTDSELLQASRLVDRIARAAPLRRSRRLRTAEDGPVFDKRRTLQGAMRAYGYPIVRQWRRPRLVPRKLVFILDVSGSMQPYARAMLMFLQAAVRSGRRIEAFTFGTRLTRVTRELEGLGPDRALQAATRAVHDWAGGTRIAVNLQALNDRWGPRGLIRGATVVIVSDGWERGDIQSLVREMERLRLATHTLVWVNPLSGEPGYEPLAQGMAAALPYVDHFLPGHNLRSLESLAEVLETLPPHRTRRPAGRVSR